MVPLYNHFGGDIVPSLTIKNIPDDLYQRIKRSAKENRRSINNEAIVCLEKALDSWRTDPETFLEHVRRHRASMPYVHLSEEDLRAAKDEGRAGIFERPGVECAAILAV